MNKVSGTLRQVSLPGSLELTSRLGKVKHANDNVCILVMEDCTSSCLPASWPAGMRVTITLESEEATFIEAERQAV